MIEICVVEKKKVSWLNSCYKLIYLCFVGDQTPDIRCLGYLGGVLKKRQKELKGLKDLNFLLFLSLPSELKSQIEKLKTTEKLQKLILVENK